VLTHANALAVLNGLYGMGESMSDMTTLSFLPWSHIFGMVVEVHAGVSVGAAIGIVTNKDHIMDGLTKVKPDVMCVVPLLLNKVCMP
jgi:long-chain acyl-CoA synthetase